MTASLGEEEWDTGGSKVVPAGGGQAGIQVPLGKEISEGDGLAVIQVSFGDG